MFFNMFLVLCFIAVCHFELHKVSLFMGLLGKTLKGRSARPGGLPPKQNIKIRQIAKTQ